MCGIAGIINLNRTPVLLKDIELLTQNVKHRGPDGMNLWFNSEKNIAFGHHRLSILDLSENASLPMTNIEQNVTITYNGEIFNYLEIKEELLKKGHQFKSKADTEVILEAYREFGLKMLHKFNGMWAFALYDNLTNEIILSRDRFGIKPLYYYQSDSVFIFSSEVQAIQKYFGNELKPNDAVMTSIAKGSFDYHGTENTYINDIKALQAGHILKIKGKEITIKKWYTLQSKKTPILFKKQAKELKYLLEDACQIRLRSDVSVATCLSGGLDSGGITGLIKSNQNATYSHSSFCASFPGSPIDESSDAQKVAVSTNSKLHVLEIESPNPKEIESALTKCDGPMHSLAFYPIMKLYQFIKEEGITVTLDGQGPDEMLGGYPILKDALQGAFDAFDPFWFFDVYRTYAALGESEQVSHKKMSKAILKQFVLQKFYHYGYLVKRTLNLSKNANSNTQELNQCSKKTFNKFEKTLHDQFFLSPLPSILNQYDRCSMANGVECRMPYMDYRVVEYIFSLPYKSKVGNGYTKRILREALKNVIPDYTRLNKNKIGFNAPIVDWFKGPLKDWMLEQMSKPGFLRNPYFNGPELLEKFQTFLKNPNPQYHEAWIFWGPIHVNWWLNETYGKQQDTI